MPEAQRMLLRQAAPLLSPGGFWVPEVQWDGHPMRMTIVKWAPLPISEVI
jgi:hypothetical protein